MALNRREFVGAISVSLAAIGSGVIGNAWADSAMGAQRSTAAILDVGIERRSQSVGGFWRTYAWKRPATGSALEIIGGQDEFDTSVIRLSREMGERPREYRLEEFGVGEPQWRIREQFGDGVLQELLEEIDLRRVKSSTSLSAP